MARVLLVDDDIGFASAAAKHLTKAGYHVIIAINPIAAVQAVETEEIDLLLIDIRLPPGKMNGIALARIARACRPSLPIIYMTADSQLAVEAAPSAIILRKPLELEALMREVESEIATLRQQAADQRQRSQMRRAQTTYRPRLISSIAAFISCHSAASTVLL